MHDLRVQFKVLEIKPNQKTTVVGKIVPDEINKECSLIVPFDTEIRYAGFCCICGCGDMESNYIYHEAWLEHRTKDQVIDQYKDTDVFCRWCLRFCGFFLHFLSIYLILYPLIMLLSMIPFIGAVGATILILFAFIFALISFLFIVACAWIIARPILAIFFFAVIIGLFFLTRASRDKYANYNPNDPYGTKGSYDQESNNPWGWNNNQQGNPNQPYGYQGGNNQGGYNQNYQGGYNTPHQGGYNQQQYPQGGYNQQQYPQGGYNQQQYPQGGYNQQQYPQGGYNQPPQNYGYGYQPKQKFL